MGEVLSQSEIDKLLNALSSGEIDADEMNDANDKQVKNYDFKRPTKFSKEHLRTLEIIYEHYGRLLSTSLPIYLRKNIQISVASSETVIYSEFTNALSNPVILGIVNFQPLGGTILIELATQLGYAMIDRMLGGAGEPLEKNRDFTEIEMTIIEKMMVVCMQLMRERCGPESCDGEDRNELPVRTGHCPERYDRDRHAEHEDRRRGRIYEYLPAFFYLGIRYG